MFESKYNFEVEPFQLRSQKYPTPELQLETALVRFLCDYASPNTLYIIYYAGHGWINSGDGDDEDFKLGAYDEPYHIIWKPTNSILLGKQPQQHSRIGE